MPTTIGIDWERATAGSPGSTSRRAWYRDKRRQRAATPVVLVRQATGILIGSGARRRMIASARRR